MRITRLIVLLLAMATVSLAYADDIDRVRELRNSESILPLSVFVKSIKASYPDSTLLDVELEEEHGQIVYEIKMMDRHHHIHKLEFDAKSGKLLGEGDD